MHHDTCGKKWGMSCHRECHACTHSLAQMHNVGPFNGEGWKFLFFSPSNTFGNDQGFLGNLGFFTESRDMIFGSDAKISRTSQYWFEIEGDGDLCKNLPMEVILVVRLFTTDRVERRLSRLFARHARARRRHRHFFNGDDSVSSSPRVCYWTFRFGSARRVVARFRS